MNKFSLILWIVCMVSYIANIVIICVNGPTLANNILAWCCSIILAITNFLLTSYLKKLKNKGENENERI